MIIDADGVRIAVLGDPHLGRKFHRNVPLHRRGEREEMQWKIFRESLMVEDVDVHVCMGDLFDKSVVPYNVVLRTYECYLEATATYPDRDYVVIKGNHDGSRDADFRSAFDVLAKMLVNDVHFAEGGWSWTNSNGIAFCPWDAFKTAEEIAADIPDSVTHVFGHWDVAGVSHNFVPVELLKGKHIYTGHDHKRRVEVIRGVPVNVVGSMMPYAHGEDADDAEPMFVTLTLDELTARLEWEKAVHLPPGDTYRNKCVRLDLKPGEVPPEIDCLQLSVRRVKDDGQPEEVDVNFDTFDMQALFQQSMNSAGVPDSISRLILAKYNEDRLGDVE